jgi:hypothetical protein
MDVITHRHDLHGALRLPPPAEAPGATEADAESFRFAVGGFVAVFGRRLAGAGLPTVRFADGDWSGVAGTEEPAVQVNGRAYEFFRGLAGRRSEAQIRGWSWSADPAPYLDLLSPFGRPAARDVEESTP